MGEKLINCEWLHYNAGIISSLTKITQSKSYSGKRTKVKSYYGRLICHEQFEDSSRLGVLNNRDPDPHVCIVKSYHRVSKYVIDTWLQFVYMSKRTFSGNILSPEFSFSFDFFILHSASRKADDVQTERKGS